MTFPSEHHASFEYTSKLEKIELHTFGQIKLFQFYESTHRLDWLQNKTKNAVKALSVFEIKQLLMSDSLLENFAKIESDDKIGEFGVLVSLVKNETGFWSGGMINIYTMTLNNIKSQNWDLVCLIIQVGAGFTVPDLIEIEQEVLHDIDKNFKPKEDPDKASELDVLHEVLNKIDEKRVEEAICLILRTDNIKLFEELASTIFDHSKVNEIFDLSLKMKSFLVCKYLVCRYPSKLLQTGGQPTDILNQVVEAGNPLLVSDVLNQYSFNFNFTRPSVSEVTSSPSNAAEALSVFNQVATKRKKKLKSRILSTDISRGREGTQIRLVNDFDDLIPEQWQYASVPKPLNDVRCDESLATQQKCDCKGGDCTDPSVCSCLKLSGGRNYSKNGRLQGRIYVGNEYELIPVIYECNQFCGCSPDCANRSRRLPFGSTTIEVFRAPGMGWGVRATQEIPKGTFIGRYAGELITNNEAEERNDTYLFDISITNGKDFTFCVDAHRIGNFGRFFNHICEPNMHAVRLLKEHQDFRFPEMGFFAIRDIAPGDQLGFDYGEGFWNVKLKDGIECCCGKDSCKYKKQS